MVKLERFVLLDFGGCPRAQLVEAVINMIRVMISV